MSRPAPGRSGAPAPAPDAASTPASAWVRIGVVGRPHGVRGALRIHLDNPDSELLDPGLSVRLRKEERARVREAVYAVANVFGGGDRVELEDLGDRDDAEAWRGAEVAVRREDFPPLEEDESYLIDLVGARVTDPAGRELGVIEAFTDNGAQPLAVVRTTAGPVDLPFVPGLVASVDEAAKVVVVDAPVGLFEGEAEEAAPEPHPHRRRPRARRKKAGAPGGGASS